MNETSQVMALVREKLRERVQSVQGRIAYQSDLPAEEAQAMFAELAVLQGCLGALQGALLPRVLQQAQREATAPADDDRLMTYAESAEWLRASQSYVETNVRQGKLRAVTLPATAKGTGEHARERDGRARRIRLGDLKAFVLAQEG